MIFRNATQDDLDIIAKIERESYHPDLVTSRNGFKNILDSSGERGGLFVVQGKDGTLVGFSHIDFILTPATCTICDVAIDQNYRRQGFASFALSAIIEMGKNRAIRQFELYVPQSNFSAVSLYKKFNFSVVRQLNKYYPEDQDGWVMKLVQ